MAYSVKKSVLLLVSMGVLIGLSSASPNTTHAQNYQRITEASMPPAPINNNSNNGNTSNFGLSGQEAAPYAYGYSFNMPSDGKWRFIAERCFSSSEGNTCVSGHWIRRVQGRCEETTAHNIRRGNYIQIIPAGPVSTCRN